MGQFKLSPWIIGLVVIVVVVVALVLVGGIKRPGSLPGEPTAGLEGEAGLIGESVAPGTSPVTEEGEVVTEEGIPVRLDVKSSSPEAPSQSGPLNEEDLPKEAIKLQVSPEGFTPDTFTVKSGDAITISVTSVVQTHIFRFDNPDLSAIAIGIGPDETRAITFNAPSKGEYSFFCDVPGHKARGETGVMVVE